MCNIRRNKIYILYYLKQKEKKERKRKEKKKKKSQAPPSVSFNKHSPFSRVVLEEGRVTKQRRGNGKRRGEEIGAKIERGNGLI